MNKSKKSQNAPLNQEEKMEKLLAINTTLNKIALDLHNYESKVTGLFQILDSEGNLITLQSLQSKIRTAQSLIDEIRKVPKPNPKLSKQESQELNDQITIETENIQSMISELKQEIQNGNTDIIPLVQAMLNEYKSTFQMPTKQKKQSNSVNFVTFDDLQRKINKINSILDDIEPITAKFHKLKHAQKDFASEKETKELRNEAENLNARSKQIKYPSKLERNAISRMKQPNNEELEEINLAIQQVDSSLSKSQLKIDNLCTRLENLDGANTVLKGLMNNIADIPRMKAALSNLLENSNLLAKLSPEFDIETQRRVSKLQKGISETTQHIIDNCKKPTKEQIAKYFSQMSYDIDTCSNIVSNVHSRVQNSVTSSVFSKSLVEIQRQEEIIKRQINEREKQISNAKKNEPLTDKSAKAINKRIMELRDQTYLIPVMVKKAEQLMSDQESLLNDIRQIQSENDENKSEIMALKKSIETIEIANGTVDSSVIRERIAELTNDVNEIKIPKEESNDFKEIKTRAMELDTKISEIEKKIDEREKEGEHIRKQQLTSRIESSIKELNENTIETNRRIYEHVNSQFSSVTKKLSREMDKICDFALLSQNSASDLVEKFESDANDMLEKCHEIIVTNDMIDEQINNVSAEGKSLFASMQQIRLDFAKQGENDGNAQPPNLVDDVIKCCNSLFDAEKEMAIVSSTVLLPLHDIERKLKSVNSGLEKVDLYKTVSNTTNVESVNIPSFDWKNQPTLARVSQKEAKSIRAERENMYKRSKIIADSLKGKLDMSEESHMKLNRIERDQEKILKKNSDLGAKPKTSKATGKVPLMNWSLIKYKLSLED